jgi:hypothetical protein
MTQAVLLDQMIQPVQKLKLKDGVNQRVGKMLPYLLHVCRIFSISTSVNQLQTFIKNLNRPTNLRTYHTKGKVEGWFCPCSQSISFEIVESLRLGGEKFHSYLIRN